MAECILVPGGAGYIGSHTVRYLLQNGYKVVAVDSLINGKAKAIEAANPGATLVVADLADKAALKAVFDEHKPTAVIDFVAFLAVGESQADPNMYMQNNVVNFVNLLDCMKESGCKYVIKSSTSSSYGDPDPSEFPLKEDYQDRYKPEVSALGEGTANFPGGDGKTMAGEEFFNAFIAYYHSIYADRPELALSAEDQVKLRIPMSIYGLTKLIDELLMAKYEADCGLKWMALRYFNVCGAAEEGDIGEDKARPSTLMTMCIYHLVCPEKYPQLKIFGTDYATPDGTAIRDYIHPSDLATGHLSAYKLLKETQESNKFNLGNGKGDSVLQVMVAVEKASGLEIKRENAPRRAGDPALSICDPSRANTILNWTPAFDLEAMARTAWAWHSTHPDGYATVPA